MFRESYMLAFAMAAIVALVGAKGEPETVGAAALEYPSQYYDPAAETEYIILKKADAQAAHWNRLYNDWGKRADQWKNLNHMWGKRSAPVPSRWDKRPQPQWNELSGYWGKRSAQ